ncbi:MAG: cysteine hydrolase [Clostridia bacterium]|nr:cysteine hydrolase [Clostridia bacterium]
MRALIVIDMQEITVGKNHAQMFFYDTDLLSRINEKIKQTDDVEVYYIKNLMKPNRLNRLAPVQVYQGSPEGELVDGLSVVSNNIFEKYKPDAFSNKLFVKDLKSRNITEIEIVGVDGGGCVAYTALGAAKNGYAVTLNKKCIGTMFKKQELKLRKKLERAGVSFQD